MLILPTSLLFLPPPLPLGTLINENVPPFSFLFFLLDNCDIYNNYVDILNDVVQSAAGEK